MRLRRHSSIETARRLRKTDRMTRLLTVGYSCLAERVGNITWPDPHDDFESIMCVQDGPPDPLPDFARLVEVGGRGVAKSWNAAIDAARCSFLLFCDDDVSIDMTGVHRGVEHLRRTGHAIALGRGVDPSRQPRKSYPSTTTRLTKFNTAKPATYEMLVDLNQVRSAGDEGVDERVQEGSWQGEHLALDRRSGPRLARRRRAQRRVSSGFRRREDAEGVVYEYKTKGPEYDQMVRATLKASHTGHYRRRLIELLEVARGAQNRGDSIYRVVVIRARLG